MGIVSPDDRLTTVAEGPGDGADATVLVAAQNHANVTAFASEAVGPSGGFSC